ncbi:hypothetical protein [Caulobacter vibrioides]|uniref:hypothetical protein n=1 Tax=Caulobacter vibrioides TaxID=155892 RepID=UPI000BB4F678|nr:hypothetical protein [Caulobacter vibrioides]ATC25195.1 hypothetical protein CA608_11985 [Caulobacter vibrioides]PLR13965.1 hypothetical protein CVUC_05285 [Caulobacter vibrioides]
MSRQPSRAVMEARAPAAVETDDAQEALYRALDFFPTPPWAGRAGGEVLLLADPSAVTIDEPACGQGHMAAPLGEAFSVRASDIHPHGFGAIEDFLDPSARTSADRPDWVFTNPPFKHLGAFVDRGLEVARNGVGLLLRTTALESEGRYDLMSRLSLQATFSERVSMRLGYWDPTGSFATAYSWFLWMHPAAEAVSPLAEAIAATRRFKAWPSLLIPPGTKARLTRPDDVRRFAPAAPAPLFDEARP